jgi:Putative zincin peptidase
MALKVEDLEDHSKYRKILEISYDDLIPFILDHLKRVTGVTIFFWSACLFFLGTAIRIRVNISGYFPIIDILFHSFLGLIILPLVSVPLHELLHILPYYLSGARKIRVGMDLKQYLFYVTAHRYVATPLQFRIVAFVPFAVISIATIFLILIMPGLWKWSLSLFLFVHSTMCAGDFALLNFYFLKKARKIFTWDDADKKIAYFYEEI